MCFPGMALIQCDCATVYDRAVPLVLGVGGVHPAAEDGRRKGSFVRVASFRIASAGDVAPDVTPRGMPMSGRANAAIRLTKKCGQRPRGTGRCEGRATRP